MYEMNCIVCGAVPNKSQVTIGGDTVSKEVYFCRSHREADIEDLDVALAKCRPADQRLREE